MVGCCGMTHYVCFWYLCYGDCEEEYLLQAIDPKLKERVRKNLRIGSKRRDNYEL